MGHCLAQELNKAGARVTVLEGPVTQPFRLKAVRTKKFHYYREFWGLLKKELKKNFDIIVHAAAVADYQLKKPYTAKLRSGRKDLRLSLVPTERLINKIKVISPDSFLVGFKLESTINKKNLKAKISDLFHKARCDLVVANHLKNTYYTGYIINRQNQILAYAQSRKDLARQLVKAISEQV